MKSYIEGLLDSLLAVFPESKKVSIKREIADFTVSSQKAVSVGIIVNELFTNIFKYAFEGKDGGKVLIELTKTDNHVRLAIADNGIGIDERIIGNKSPGFGLSLVKMLSEQLYGSYTVESVNGTRSVLEFEL